MNLVRGTTGTTLRWGDEFVANLVPAAILRYLAVAHYGRGRGEWSESEHPAFWRNVVMETIERRGGMRALANLRAKGADEGAREAAWRDALAGLARNALARLYPDADARTPDVVAPRTQAQDVMARPGPDAPADR